MSSAARANSDRDDSDAVVITGAGMITSLGIDRETTWRAVREGRCGCGPLTAMEQPLPEGKDGGQAVDLPADYDPDKPREVRYLRRAIADALADAGLPMAGGRDVALPYAAERCGLLFGTTLHGMRGAGRYLRTGDYEPLRQFLAANVLRDAARDMPFAGVAATHRDDGQPSFAILQGPASPLVAPLASTMPIVIPPDGYAAWQSGPRDRAVALTAVPPVGWRADPVSTWVNSVEHDDPKCVESTGNPSQGELF